MEKELAKMRAGLTESVQLMEQREMNTNIEYSFPDLILFGSFKLFDKISKCSIELIQRIADTSN